MGPCVCLCTVLKIGLLLLCCLKVCVCVFFFLKDFLLLFLMMWRCQLFVVFFFFLVEKNGKKKSKGRIIRSTAAFAVFHFPELIIILLSCWPVVFLGLVPSSFLFRFQWLSCYVSSSLVSPFSLAFIQLCCALSLFAYRVIWLLFLTLSLFFSPLRSAQIKVTRRSASLLFRAEHQPPSSTPLPMPGFEYSATLVHFDAKLSKGCLLAGS